MTEFWQGGSRNQLLITKRSKSTPTTRAEIAVVDTADTPFSDPGTSSASDQDSSLPDAPSLVTATKAKRKGWKDVIHTRHCRQRWSEIEELLTQKDLADVESELRRLTRHLPLEFKVTRRRDTDHVFVTRLRHSLWVGKYVELYDTIDERMLPVAGALLALFKTVPKKTRTSAFKACWNRHKAIHGMYVGRCHALGYNTSGESLAGES